MRVKIFLLTVFIGHFVCASEWSIESGVKKNSLIELYSSEGCSSCPPADKWLASLKGHPRLWKDFVPVEFHVDYWNRLGWIDTFSHQNFTRRQRQYANQWGERTVYTPAFVLNGSSWKLGEQKIPSEKSKDVGVLKAKKIKSGTFHVQFQPKKKGNGFKLNGALLGNGLATEVSAGENNGKILRHEFVALNFVSVPFKKTAQGYEAEISLSQVSKSQAKPKSHSVVFWVSRGFDLTPIQVVGGDL